MCFLLVTAGGSWKIPWVSGEVFASALRHTSLGHGEVFPALLLSFVWPRHSGDPESLS